MLNRNLWMIWPTGYYGSYIHWLISRAEKDLKKNTVDSPFFSNGSSHAHIKNPPHQTIENLIQARIRNNYPDGTIYPIGIRSNVSYTGSQPNWMKSFENSFFWTLRLEHEPVLINIYNGSNEYYTKLAVINMYNKENWVVESYPDENDYYCFKDTDAIKARNYLVKNWKTVYPWHDKQATVETVNLYREPENAAIQTRYKNESWEYNRDDNWIYATGRYLYNIKLEEILNVDFISRLENILVDCEIGDFDFSDIKTVHTEFLSRQKTYIDITSSLYVQADTLQYNPELSKNILYEALAIDALMEKNILPDDWQILTLKEIVENAKSK